MAAMFLTGPVKMFIITTDALQALNACGAFLFIQEYLSECNETGGTNMASHEVKIRVMKTVSEGTKEIIRRRTKRDDLGTLFSRNSALALIHGDVCEMIYASDVAQKASDVEVFEIMGSCPQHMTCLGILGDAAAVETAVQKVRNAL